MLALKQALSLTSTPKLGSAWVPSDEASCEAHWKYNTDITYDAGTKEVSKWADQTTNGHDMEQSAAGWFPLYNTGTGAVDYFGSNDSLETSIQIDLTDDWCVGFKIYPTAFTSKAIIGDNSTANYWIRLGSTTSIQVKFGTSTVKGISLDSGTFDSECYGVLVKNGTTDNVSFYFNGVLQSTSSTLAGNLFIDSLGIRKTNVNDYEGAMYDVSVFTSIDGSLIDKLNDYLSKI